MKRLWIFGMAGLLISAQAAWCADSKDAKTDDKAILGVWLPTGAEFTGKVLPEEGLKAIRLELTDGKYKVTVKDTTDEGTTKISPEAKPKALDIVGVKGPNTGKTILAIYELKDDTLRVCYDLSGKARPKEFETKSGAGLLMITYKREKK